jgi:hypothetical protein
MQKNVVVSILSIVLLVLVLLTIGYGCSFKFEGFEDGHEDEEEVKTAKDTKSVAPAATAPAAPARTGPTALTPSEKEMFENIKNGTLTDKDIQTFIAEGKLTEQMVEKFLEHIDAPALATPTKTSTPAPKTPAVVEEDFEVEGFSGSMYAQF